MLESPCEHSILEYMELACAQYICIVKRGVINETNKGISL